MHRLFVALRPPRPHRERLLGIMGGVPGARWQDDAQLHLTLRFIGEVDSRAARDVADALTGVRQRRFGLALDGLGRFDKRGGGALWAGVSPTDEVTALHRKVDHALIRAGFEPEGRAYLPHITIARLPRSAGPAEPFLADHAGLSAPIEIFAAFHLYESHLGREGSSYEIVETYPLY